MSESSNPTAGGRKGLYLVLGGLLRLGSLAALGYSGKAFWTLWRNAAHPAPVPAGATPAKTPAKNVWADIATSRELPWFVGGLLGLFVGVRVLQVSGRKGSRPGEAGTENMATVDGGTKTPRRSANKRWQSCNVLQVDINDRHLWAFTAVRGGFALSKQQSIPAVEPLPLKLVAKDWKTLFQPKLNIAWLPVEQVFLRVAHLPAGSFDETLAMVELQLEKLSPLPVTQIVWSIQILPQKVDDLQSVIVIIVARDLVQEFLGRLEEQGYLADQLELPMLDQLLATPISGDGAWVYASPAGGKLTALVAWWYGGALRNLGLLHVASVENRDALLKEQLTQMAWAGELEGWLTAAPHWHLVADEATAAEWQPMFRTALGQPAELVPPLSQTELAALTARRMARAEDKAGILPVEYSARYHQEFVDRLWLRGLMAVLAVYGFGVMIYFAALQYQEYRTDKITNEAATMSREYTNTLQLKDQLSLLQERDHLKFAALDCWKYTAELLPESVTLNSLEFRNGKTLVLNGKAPADQRNLVTDFNEALRKAVKDGTPLFGKVDPPAMKLTDGNTAVSWNFNAELARSEEATQ